MSAALEVLIHQRKSHGNIAVSYGYVRGDARSNVSGASGDVRGGARPAARPPVPPDRRRHASMGATAAAAWLANRGIDVEPGAPWEVSIALDVVDRRPSATFTDTRDTRFHISIGSDEWGFFFCHGGRTSWLRVTDRTFVHERDDHDLLGRVPSLRDLGKLVQSLEERHRFRLRREHAAIRSAIRGAAGGPGAAGAGGAARSAEAEDNVRIWVVASL